MLVPIVYGYLIAVFATAIVKRWRMTGPFRIGGAYAQHGFIYGSKLAFVLLLVAPLDLVSAALLAGAATAFGGWWHDVYAIREGKIVFPGMDARAAEESLTSFAPATYFAVGATYAAAILAGSRIVASRPDLFPWVFVAALAALCVVPTLVFSAITRTAR
jgi:hypothetical protein